MGAFYGFLLVILGGLVMGSGHWPIKLMRKFRYEQWAFISNLCALIIAPWALTLIFCPNALAAYKTVDFTVLLKSNIFSLSWGVANVLCLLCFIRIGFSLTGAILTGLGVSVGVITPMIFKAPGIFEDAPDVTTPAGLVVIFGVAVMIAGVIYVAVAGFGRDRILGKSQTTSANFLAGLIMVIIAGVTSAGISFSFVYSQDAIKEVMKAEGASEIASTFAVLAAALLGGALVNILYPAFLMTRNKSWNILKTSTKEIVFGVIIGINFCIAVALMGQGMIFLGALGASIGWGIQQAMQMLGSQAVGFISGEWRGVKGNTRHLMYAAITFLIIAAVVMSYGRSLVG